MPCVVRTTEVVGVGNLVTKFEVGGDVSLRSGNCYGYEVFRYTFILSKNENIIMNNWKL